jgi:hypothetical protein
MRKRKRKWFLAMDITSQLHVDLPKSSTIPKAQYIPMFALYQFDRKHESYRHLLRIGGNNTIFNKTLRQNNTFYSTYSVLTQHMVDKIMFIYLKNYHYAAGLRLSRMRPIYASQE